jgi:hypothetical protein
MLFPPFLRKMVWDVTDMILGKRMLDEDRVCYVCSDVVPLNTQIRYKISLLLLYILDVSHLENFMFSNDVLFISYAFYLHL